jgi:hypothetical protein
MTTESRELTIWIENDGNLYRRQTLPIIKNLQKKIAKGTYDPKKALILWKHLADSGAISYAKEFGGVYHEMFSVADRKAAAIELAASYDEHLKEKPVTPSRKKSQAKRVTEYFGNPKKRRKRAKHLTRLEKNAAMRVANKKKLAGFAKRKRNFFTTQVMSPRKVTPIERNPAFGKRKSQKHIIEAVHLKPLKFWYWNGHAVEDKRTHAFIFPTRAAAYAKAKEIRNQLPQGFKALRVIPE